MDSDRNITVFRILNVLFSVIGGLLILTVIFIFART
jgi:hypothetical protein